MSMAQIQSILEAYGGQNWRDLFVLGLETLLLIGFGIVVLSLLWRAWK